MKFTGTLSAAIIAMFGIGSQICDAQDQSYYYSGPVTGYIDANLEPNSVYGYGFGGFQANFGTISETLTYDPVAQTLEEDGTFTLSPSSGTFGMYALVNGIGGVAAVGTASLTLGNNGSVSFDYTSAESYDRFFGTQGFASPSLAIPVNGSGVYLGQAFSGSWDIDVSPLITEITAITPTTLTFTQIPEVPQVEAGVNGFLSAGQQVVGALSDAGGVNSQVNEYPGVYDINSAVATAVPEPNSFVLLGLGMSASALFAFQVKKRAVLIS